MRSAPRACRASAPRRRWRRSRCQRRGRSSFCGGTAWRACPSSAPSSRWRARGSTSRCWARATTSSRRTGSAAAKASRWRATTWRTSTRRLPSAASACRASCSARSWWGRSSRLSRSPTAITSRTCPRCRTTSARTWATRGPTRAAWARTPAPTTCCPFCRRRRSSRRAPSTRPACARSRPSWASCTAAYSTVASCSARAAVSCSSSTMRASVRASARARRRSRPPSSSS